MCFGDLLLNGLCCSELYARVRGDGGAHACSGLYHPHVVQMHAIVRTQHFLCIVMELANGGDIFRLVKSSGGLPEPAARFIFQQLALTLGYLHSVGMYIRDVKPSNLLIFWNASGMPILKITDFNLAKDTSSQVRHLDSLSAQMQRATPVFAASPVSMETSSVCLHVCLRLWTCSNLRRSTTMP